MRQTFTTIAGMALLFFTTANTFATPWIQETRLVASDGDHEDRFGESVSISGDGKTVLVGAHFNDDNGNNSGTAYIKERIGGIWYETKLVASDGQSNDRFGGSVSISEDGNTAIIGAINDDDNGYEAGAAYIYKLVGGAWQETKIIASDGESYDNFGISVSISGDGTVAIVGAYLSNGDNTESGSAYIYKLVGGAWQEIKIIPSDGASSDYFGFSVSMSPHGHTAIVGAFGDGSASGSAYIYEELLDSGDWQETKLVASDGSSSDYFGLTVSISSEGTAIVGARNDGDNGTGSGSAYIYQWPYSSGETKLLASDGGNSDSFGQSVSVSSDGTTAIVGSSYSNGNSSRSGSAYIYELVDGVWQQENKLVASDGWTSDHFGGSVSISANGETAIIAAHGANIYRGAAYIFVSDADGDGIPDSVDNCYLDNPDQLDCNGNGIGDVCDIADGTSFDCDQNGVPDECQSDCDGDGLIDPCDTNDSDVDGDGIPDNCEADCNGNSIPDDYEIELDPSLDSNGNGVLDSCVETKLLASDWASNDRFGKSVSISGDGKTVLVGAYTKGDNNTESGAAYVYKLVGGAWQETKLVASDVSDGDHFGNSVSISDDGTTAIVGAVYNDDFGSDSGSAYMYTFVSGAWQETKLLASDGAASDFFGTSVSISGDGITAIVGAFGDDDNGSDSGSAYMYTLVSGAWQETKLLASDGTNGDYFGNSVSISGDGATAIVGATYSSGNNSNSGSAYTFKFIDGAWQETKLLASDGASGDNFGTSVSISSDGTTVLVGASGDDDLGSNSGSIYIYKNVDGVWEEAKGTAYNGTTDDYFGNAVSISGDGTTAIVGAHFNDDNGNNSGTAYIIKQVFGDWIENGWLMTNVSASDGAISDTFGVSVSISGDGNAAIVGAYGDGDNSSSCGSAYVYEHIDTDGDGVLDYVDNCYLFNPGQQDCNGNGIGDVCDIADETSFDCNQNGVPDECECYGDLNGDSEVNIEDILILIGQWGASGPYGDINGDGAVNIHDLLIIISVFGDCTNVPCNPGIAGPSPAPRR